MSSTLAFAHGLDLCAGWDLGLFGFPLNTQSWNSASPLAMPLGFPPTGRSCLSPQRLSQDLPIARGPIRQMHSE